MITAKAIHLNGNSHYLQIYFSSRPSNIVDAECYITRSPP